MAAKHETDQRVHSQIRVEAADTNCLDLSWAGPSLRKRDENEYEKTEVRTSVTRLNIPETKGLHKQNELVRTVHQDSLRHTSREENIS
jgi:hypothetical protein